ncbi:hypothetical protein PG987_013319 [Apiospora arundinis]
MHMEKLQSNPINMSSRWNDAYYLDMAQHRSEDAYEGPFQRVQTEAIQVSQALQKRKETSHGDGDGTKRELSKKLRRKWHRGHKGAKKPPTVTTKSGSSASNFDTTNSSFRKGALTPVKRWASELKKWGQNHETKGKRTVVDGERGYLKYHKLDDDDSRE